MKSMIIGFAIVCLSITTLWCESEGGFHVTYFRVSNEDALNGVRLPVQGKAQNQVEEMVLRLLTMYKPSEKSVMLTTRVRVGKMPEMTASYLDKTVRFTCETVLKSDGLINVKQVHLQIIGLMGETLKDRTERYDDSYGFDEKPLFFYQRIASELDGSVTDVEGIVLHKAPLGGVVKTPGSPTPTSPSGAP